MGLHFLKIFGYRALAHALGSAVVNEKLAHVGIGKKDFRNVAEPDIAQNKEKQHKRQGDEPVAERPHENAAVNAIRPGGMRLRGSGFFG